MPRILCVDDEPAVLNVLRRALSNAGHQVLTAGDPGDAFDVIRTQPVDLILSDYRMPGQNGIEFLHRLSRDGIDTPVVMLTGHANVEGAVQSMKAGAVDYLSKPIRSDQLELVVNQAIESHRLRGQSARSGTTAPLPPDRSIVGESEALRALLNEIPRIAPTRASVLIMGESGTGKELFARAIHEASDRANQPFVAINCAALPESLVESVLFGHERGAFTGAVRQVKGVFERADRGTLLLDEISEMRIDLQAKLLRVLQEQEFERVGGSTPVRVDVRILATTNRDLKKEIEATRFREDLYYRLGVVQMRIPPLRERREDIPLLVEHFRRKAISECARRIDGFTGEAIARLQDMEWPGNVRELAHTVERAVILSREPQIGPEALAAFAGSSPATNAGNGSGRGSSEAPAVTLPSLNIAEAEKLLIDAALAATNNNRTEASRLLGISVRTLRNKLNRPEGRAD